jgi:hypothetical protein
LVNKDRHEKITKKIKESVEYRTLNKQELVTQVVALGEFLHRCCHDQNSWPTALREQMDQEKRGIFRMVFADHVIPRAPAFDNCVMKAVAIFNSPHDRVGDGLLEGIEPQEQAVTHMKMATKRPMDCEDTKQEHLSSSLIEKLNDDEYVTKWVAEPTIKKSDTRTGYGGSVDTEPGAKPGRPRNMAPVKRSNLDPEKFLTTWRQVATRFDFTENTDTDGVTKIEITANDGKATVTLNMRDKTATLANQSMDPTPLRGVESVFEAAATAGGVKK